VHWDEFKGLHGLHQHKLKKTVVHKQHSHSICKAHQYPRLMVGNIRQLKTATLPTALPLRQRNSRACTRGATTKPPPLSPGTPQTSWRGPFNQELVLSLHFRLKKHKRYLPVLPLFKYTKPSTMLMNQNKVYAIESLHTLLKRLELITVKRLHDGTPIAPGLPDTETDPTNDPPQQERTPIPEKYILPDCHQEAKEKEHNLVEYSDHRMYITLAEVYRAAINSLSNKGHHIILEDKKYSEEHENDVDREGCNNMPRLKIKMIEACNGQLFLLEMN
jgi:hypothetical protein